MNIETFKKLKNSPDALILTNEMAMLISMLAVGSRKSRSNVRGGNQLLKNPKMQLLKDKVENKVNLVLRLHKKRRSFLNSFQILVFMIFDN